MTWWQEAVFYHIYLRSFQDSNDDGIGDLPGVIQRLDYVTDLGVDAIWLSPFYPSPQKDFGYDVANYTDVDPVYGTLNDLDDLLSEAHQRGIRVILDLIPNHTSDQHPWFKQSRSSRTAPRRDWYIWRDPAADGGPPNNWLSLLGGSAWTLDVSTGQYYLHSFLPEQVDLNWRHPDVARALHSVMRFWLSRGVDGFRVDVIQQTIKDAQYRNNPPNPQYRVSPESPHYNPYLAQHQVYSTMQPEVFEVVRGLRAVVEEYGEALLLGEIAVFDSTQLVKFFAEDLFHLGFNFNLLHALTFEDIRGAILSIDETFPGTVWPTLAFSSHDVARSASRLSRGDSYDTRRVRLAALLLLTLRGTPFLYYGEELGMPDTPIPDNLLRDPAGIFERDNGTALPGILSISGRGRDPERAPMPWSGEPQGGFSQVDPWLPMTDPTVCNVEQQMNDPGSMWSWVHHLLELRRRHPALRAGDYRPLPTPEGLWAYLRRHQHEDLVVVANLEGSPTADLSHLFDAWGIAPAELVVQSPSVEVTHLGENSGVALQPYEGIVLTGGQRR